MSLQDVLNVAIVVILVYLCLYSLVNRVCKTIELTSAAKSVAQMSNNCSSEVVEKIITTCKL